MAINNNFGTGVLDELIVTGNTGIHTKAIQLAAGTGTLKRGQLIATDTDGDFGAVNGTYTDAYGILTEDVTLNSGAPVKAIVYVSGNFNANKVIGYVEASHYDALREKGIFVEKALAY